jgi:type III pantothenate kinase
VENMDPLSSVLDIDVGNSRIKWRSRLGGSGTRGTIEHDQSLDSTKWPALQIGRIRISSVGSKDSTRELCDWLQSHFGVMPEFARTTRFAAGVTCGYEDPTRLGVDRWLSVLAARQLSKQPLMVIGLGTAGTLDFVDADGIHKGGFIVPGLRLMTEALFAGTADVRVSFEASSSQQPGTNTPDAVRRGVVSMLADFINGSIRRFSASCNGVPHVYLCGGDAGIIEPLIEVPVELRPDLVLDGLAVALP